MNPQSANKVKRAAGRAVRAVLVGVIISLLGVYFVGRPYQVVYDSMRPTLDPGAKVFVVNENLNRAQLDDIVVVRDPLDNDKLLVKRLVGVQGDVLEARGGVLYRNGSAVSETYLPNGVRTAGFGPITVGYQEVFVVGDNRSVSFDSRDFGPVPADSVVGVVSFVIWPWPRLVG